MSKRLIVSVTAIVGLGACLIPAASAGANVEPETIIPFASDDWAYYRGVAAPPAEWKSGSVDWRTDSAPFGFGRDHGTVNTVINNDFSRKPLASYFRKSFHLDSVPEDGLTLTTWADDGVIAYLNGEEVVRKNLPPGRIDHSSYAINAPQSKNARAHPVSVEVDAADLKVGQNIISVQVQSNWRATFNSSFDAQLVAQPLEDRPVTPTPPPPTATTPPPAPTTPPPPPAPTTPPPPPAPTTPPPPPAPTTPPPPPAPTTPPPPPAPTTPPPPLDAGNLAGWGTPDWRDEFSFVDAKSGKPVIDESKWNIRERSDLGILFDAAVPSRDQVSVDADGVAHLRADWLSSPAQRGIGVGVPNLWHKTAYMDQRVLERDDASYSQQYGRWEIRAKVPTGPKTYGALAAFWLRNSQSGEIDIMEAWGYNDAAAGGQRIDTATTTVHTQTSGAGNKKYVWHHADYGAAVPVWDDFHTYGFELTPAYAAIFFDGVKIATATPASHPNLWDKKFFNSPLHVRLNLHVGPSAEYWGIPDPAHRDWTKPLDYQVDYVRIWKYEP